MVTPGMMVVTSHQHTIMAATAMLSTKASIFTPTFRQLLHARYSDAKVLELYVDTQRYVDGDYWFVCVFSSGCLFWCGTISCFGRLPSAVSPLTLFVS